jgi:hypothetical protein
VIPAGVPAAVERARQRVHERIVVARFVGELVVRQVGVELERRVAARRAAGRPNTSPSAGPAADAGMPTVTTSLEPAPAVGALPIDGYDSLPAAHVITLLDALDPAGLATVAAYERSHRRRRTVLGRLEQLHP